MYLWRRLSPTLSSMMRHWIARILYKLAAYCANLALTGVLVSNNNASWHICCEGYLLAKIPRATMGKGQFMRWSCNTTQGRLSWGWWNAVQVVLETVHYRLEASIVCTLVNYPPHLTPSVMRCSHFRWARNVPSDVWVAFPIDLKDPWVIFDWVAGVELPLWRIVCHWISAAANNLEINIVQ